MTFGDTLRYLWTILRLALLPPWEWDLPDGTVPGEDA